MNVVRRCGDGHPAPALRLFCFPFAGAGASVYSDWRLPDELVAEVWAVQPPGREDRRREPPARALTSLLAEYTRELAPLLDRPFALFGHSMGAMIAFELARQQRRHGGRQPCHLFLSGHRAPDRPPKRAPMSSLPDEQLVARLLEMAGTSPSAIRDPELLLFGASVLRADLELCERYRFRPAEPLSTPVTCFAARDDSEVDPPDVAAWEAHTTAPCRTVTLTGGHLFPRDHHRRLLDEMASDLVRSAVPAPGRPGR